MITITSEPGATGTRTDAPNEEGREPHAVDGLVSTGVHPIIPGFHPDPTVCRVGDDYYLAHSSFEYSPGVPVWHSRNLLHWTLLGNALERADQLPAGHAAASGGVYAPTLRHHDGRFWLITTDVSTEGQLVVWATDAAGPWSAALALPDVRGIDPDLAWDDEGRCWVTYASGAPGIEGIVQVQVDLGTGRTLSDPRVVWAGTGLAFPEAPHLYRVGSWWYLVIAEGGTERGHSVTVARSTRPDGPFVPAPSNPLLSHRSTTHPVQNTGHADFVQLGDGSWAMVYLGVRPRGITPLFHVLGRETFLAGIDWSDGWPSVDEDRFVRRTPDTSFTEPFGGPRLDPRWVSPGEAPMDFVTVDPTGGITLRAGIAANGARSALTTRILDLRWCLEADVDAGTGVGGLLLRLDDRHWCEIQANGEMARAVVCIGPLEATVGPELATGRGPVTVRMESLPSESAGPDDIALSIVVDGREMRLARIDGRYFSTEVAGGFTGRVAGVRAVTGTVGVSEVRYTGYDRADIAAAAQRDALA
ncbi:glycoside hydrolase family 43 protein [Planctomonas psychrotolerans]|uniref:glycoside hydrolase family 43 protein n=1 Tax=Planctomonas psychrotolerans TaxID=2528712 RepID=UPI00123BA591|nr:glycoside hydrolase family 43 protein [Planctomonas psychrotolerans]